MKQSGIKIREKPSGMREVWLVRRNAKVNGPSPYCRVRLQRKAEKFANEDDDGRYA